MMEFFFSESANFYQEGQIEISGSEFKHAIKVLRHQPGEIIHVTNGKGLFLEVEITNIRKTYFIGKIIVSKIIETAPLIQLGICAGVLKSMSRYELFIQKAVELGATDIFPMKTERTILSLNSITKKVARWQNILIAACKQSQRYFFPTLHSPDTLENLLFSSSKQKILYYEKEQKFFSAFDPFQNICIFIGPEGGFEEEEVNLAVNEGATVSGLGNQVLRTETAALVALSAIKLKKMSS